jgi:hypothetical protein
MFSSCRRLALAAFVLAVPVAFGAPAGAEASRPAPKILAVDLSDRVFHRNEKMRWQVTTSANVGSVTAEVQGRTIPMNREAPGRFALVFTVPWYIPFWYNHAWPIRFVARTPDGTQAARTVSIELR